MMSLCTASKNLTSIDNAVSFVEIDASGLEFRDLNNRIASAARSGARHIRLTRVYGQRYIGTRLNGLPPVTIEIEGVPGNDLGSFMDGHILIVHGNAQDGVGNTMYEGEIIVEGRCGDIPGMSAMGGSIFVRDDAGYRAALHMKQHGRKFPNLTVGGTAQDFLGEYMAGGRVTVLGLGCERHRMSFIGTGMHGGIIYIRGRIDEEQLGEGAQIKELKRSDLHFLSTQIERYRRLFGTCDEVGPKEFTKIGPTGTRPYSRLYS